MLETLYPILIVIGATIGGVLWYLWRQARTAGTINLALIRLNEQLEFDTPAFLQQAWPLLSKSGLRGLSWRLVWFGTTVERTEGELGTDCIVKDIAVGENNLTLRFQQNRRGEHRYFDESLIEIFLLLLRSDMWIKTNAIDATFAQMSRLTLFLQHDMKNVAQFIQLMADQLAAVPPGKELQVLNYLRTAAPLIRHRADRIVRTLTAGPSANDPVQTIDIRAELTKLCSLHQLDGIITGDARISVPENTLDTALDNVLKNYSDLGQRDGGLKPGVAMDITETPTRVAIAIRAIDATPVGPIERLFEPFWSSSTAGLGIGLYQARQLLDVCNGTLDASLNAAGQLVFEIQLQRC